VSIFTKVINAMRTLLIVAWLFAGLGGVIFHFGPGQEKLEIDRINQIMKDARSEVEQNEFASAVEKYDAVLAALPSDKVAESRGIVLEKAKAQMMAAELPKARQTLETLLTEVRNDKDSDAKFVADVQATLANSQYYTTWLMRLEGLPEAEWKPEIEAARQHYAQLTQTAKETGDVALLKRSSEDLESSIRLARMDLGDLQSLPLPSQ
jgi:tetratricopeptide (TPR) repeat protein